MGRYLELAKMVLPPKAAGSGGTSELHADEPDPEREPELPPGAQDRSDKSRPQAPSVSFVSSQEAPPGALEATAAAAAHSLRPDEIGPEAARDVAPALQEEDYGWPPESYDTAQQYGGPHCRLFPFLGRKVRTPAGSGTLLQVFADRCAVLLDSELNRCTWFHLEEVEPVSPA